MVQEDSENAGLKLNIQKTKIMVTSSITSWQIRWGKVETVVDFIFFDSKITVGSDCSYKTLAPWEKSYDEPRQCKKQRCHLAYKGIIKAMVQMWQVDHKEGWALKNWWFWTVVLEKILESPLDSKAIKPVNPKGNQPWIFMGRTDCWSSNILATWCKELTHWKRPWYWERLRAGGEGGNRGWEGWVASPIQWTNSSEIVKEREAWRAASPWGCKESDATSDWTSLKINIQM